MSETLKGEKEMKVYVFAEMDNAKKFQATAHKRGWEVEQIGTAVLCEKEAYVNVSETSYGFTGAIVEAEVERHNSCRIMV